MSSFMTIAILPPCHMVAMAAPPPYRERMMLIRLPQPKPRCSSRFTSFQHYYNRRLGLHNGRAILRWWNEIFGCVSAPSIAARHC